MVKVIKKKSFIKKITGGKSSLSFIILIVVILGLLLAFKNLSGILSLFSHADVTSTSGCGLPNPAFCDTFDQPSGIGNRSGDLNGLVWGVSRLNNSTNPSQGLFDTWALVQMQKCGSTPTVLPDQDVSICNGELVEAVNDGGSVDGTPITTIGAETGCADGTNTICGAQSDLAMYPKQPFDIAGRTGTVTFDVGADSQGGHAAWPTFVYTDQPVPAPYSQASGLAMFARNSIGFTIAATCGPWGCGSNNSYPDLGQPSFDGKCTGIDSIFITNNYQKSDVTFNQLGCVLKPTQQQISAGQLNHFVVKISQNQMQVWATDAGSTTLKEIAEADNIAVPLTRGLIWMEDVHYNGCKFNTQCVHTFIWDNVGFDGPVLPRDLAYDVLENTDHWRGGPDVSLGWDAPSTSPLALTVPNVQNVSQASGAIITLNWEPTSQDTISYQVNGNAWHTQPWVFDSTTYSWKTVALPVPLSEIQAGSNIINLKTSDNAAVANVDLVLVGAAGIPTCFNPSNCAGSLYGSSSGITPTPTPSTGSGSPTSTPTPTLTPISGSATQSIVPPTQGVVTGQTVTVTLNENSGSIPVNALQTTISYPTNMLTETGISYGSAFGIKATETIGNGTISISRGSVTPVSGSNTVATITFQAIASGTAPITLSSEQVLTSSTNQNIFSSASNGSITIAAPTPTPTPTPIAQVGDLNTDGVVDLLDLSFLLSNWGQNNTGIGSNLGNNGVVGLQDLSILLSHWGQ